VNIIEYSDHLGAEHALREGVPILLYGFTTSDEFETWKSCGMSIVTTSDPQIKMPNLHGSWQPTVNPSWQMPVTPDPQHLLLQTFL